jgi:hypothetical protein
LLEKGKELIRGHQSKKDIKYNDEKKNDKLKIEKGGNQTPSIQEGHTTTMTKRKKTGINSGALSGFLIIPRLILHTCSGPAHVQSDL